MYIIGNKFVVTLKVVISYVKIDSALLAFRMLADDVDGFLVALQKRRQLPCYERELNDLRQRLVSQMGDQLVRKSRILVRFNDHSELHGRLAHLDRDPGI